MSRCFPYPPPGYCAKIESNVALIESIELQKAREKAKAKAERKREKKEKRRERELQAKQNASELSRGRKRKLHSEKTCEWKKDKVDLKGSDIKRYRENDTEQLERSDLTEEHGQLICLENPCYSTDSIQNSNKRRKQASPVHGICAHGNIIRIRLPSKTQKDHDPTDHEERFCSTSGWTETNGRHNSEIVHGTKHEESCFTSMETDACVQGRRIQGCLISGVGRSFNQDNTMTSSSGSTAFGNGMIFESLYKDLVDNWVPPHLQREHADLDELEWLLQRKHKHEPKERCKACSEFLCIGSSPLWPRAQYLSEADMLALPFTVPF